MKILDFEKREIFGFSNVKQYPPPLLLGPLCAKSCISYCTPLVQLKNLENIMYFFNNINKRSLIRQDLDHIRMKLELDSQKIQLICPLWNFIVISKQLFSFQVSFLLSSMMTLFPRKKEQVMAVHSLVRQWPYLLSM